MSDMAGLNLSRGICILCTSKSIIGSKPQSSSSAAEMPPDTVPGTDTTLANADAERALLTLRQNLAGMKGGERCSSQQ